MEVIISLSFLFLVSAFFYWAWFKAGSKRDGNENKSVYDPDSFDQLAEFTKSPRSPQSMKAYSLLALLFSLLSVCVVLVKFFD